MVVSILECVATIISTVAACISVVIAYYSIRENNRNQKEQQERLNKQEWYQQLVLVNIVPEINEFVSESTLMLERCKECRADELDRALRSCYDEIKLKKRHLESNLQSVKVFDSALYREAQKCLSRMLDLYSDTITESNSKKHMITYPGMKDVGEVKVELIEKLYGRYLEF